MTTLFTETLLKYLFPTMPFFALAVFRAMTPETPIPGPGRLAKKWIALIAAFPEEGGSK